MIRCYQQQTINSQMEGEKMKVTIKDVQALVKQINTLKGFENVSYNTIGGITCI